MEFRNSIEPTGRGHSRRDGRPRPRMPAPRSGAGGVTVCDPRGHRRWFRLRRRRARALALRAPGRRAHRGDLGAPRGPAPRARAPAPARPLAAALPTPRRGSRRATSCSWRCPTARRRASSRRHRARAAGSSTAPPTSACAMQTTTRAGTARSTRRPLAAALRLRPPRGRERESLSGAAHISGVGCNATAIQLALLRSSAPACSRASTPSWPR